MRSEVEELINAVEDEADDIDDLVDIVRDQRYAMKGRDPAGVDDLMKEMREVFFDVQTQEGLRGGLAKKMAARWGCDPRASSLSALMEEDERALFNGAVDRLTQSVFVLKSEILILNGLVEQNEKYTSMLLSEWRRLMGDAASPRSGFPAEAGAMDFRG
ncbi:MAG: flagellar export chaperone FlgN [Fretibacterium sp.]|nr:flagellar export chaperone FlgN [Fretibacterium sp.]